MSCAGDLAWLNDYVGVPFLENGRTRAGWDCWGLVVAVYRDRLALELPDYQWRPPFGLADKLAAFGQAIDGAGGLALELEAPEAWAIGLAGYGHCGLSIGAGVLHAQRYGGTVYEPLQRFERSYPRLKWFRWRR